MMCGIYLRLVTETEDLEVEKMVLEGFLEDFIDFFKNKNIKHKKFVSFSHFFPLSTLQATSGQTKLDAIFEGKNKLITKGKRISK